MQSAPDDQPGHHGADVQISGNFSQGEAKDLALVLRYGALPVQFDETKQTVESVSPTLGRTSSPRASSPGSSASDWSRST